MSDWELVYACELAANSGSKTPLASTTPNVCRFCGRGEPEAQFKSVAHVLPQALGNQVLTSLEECDACNSRGSNYESHLTNLLMAEMHTARMTKGERKFQQGRLRVQSIGDELNFFIHPADDHVTAVETEEGLRIDLKIPSFKPALVARALARIAIFVARPQDLPHLRPHILWVNRQDSCRVPGFGLGERAHNPRTVHVGLLRLRSDDPIAYLVAVSYGRRQLVMPLLGYTSRDRNVRMQLPPTAEWRDWWDASDDDALVSNRVESIYASLPPLREPPTHADIATQAYAEWEASGRPDGRDIEFWLRAETQLRLMRRGASGSVQGDRFSILGRVRLEPSPDLRRVETPVDAALTPKAEGSDD
jgi:Protein of unknown function (DUF2934)/HNH endonuclease